MKRLLMLIAILAIAFILVACESSQQIAAREQKVKQEEAARVEKERQEYEENRKREEARKQEEIFGREIQCDKYNDNPGPSSCLAHCKAFIKKSDGIITLKFDYYENQYSRNLPSVQLLVRLFDKNGQYLRHFISEEQFMVNDYFEKMIREQSSFKRIGEHAYKRFDGMTFIRLSKNNNVFQYRINMRDSEYLDMVELRLLLPR